VAAGTMASRKGKDSAAPTPRKRVRRESDFRVVKVLMVGSGNAPQFRNLTDRLIYHQGRSTSGRVLPEEWKSAEAGQTGRVS